MRLQWGVGVGEGGYSLKTLVDSPQTLLPKSVSTQVGLTEARTERTLTILVIVNNQSIIVHDTRFTISKCY